MAFPTDEEEKKQDRVCIRCGKVMVVSEGKAWWDDHCPDPTKDATEPIPLDKLEHGAYYYGWGRNGRLARWDAHGEIFWSVRAKFRYTYTENVYYADRPVTGGFVPYCKTDTPVFEFPMAHDGWDPPLEE